MNNFAHRKLLATLSAMLISSLVPIDEAAAAAGTLSHSGRCASTNFGTCLMNVTYSGSGSTIYCVWNVSASPKYRWNCQGLNSHTAAIPVGADQVTLVLKAQSAFGSDDEATFNAGQSLATMTISSIAPRNRLGVRSNPTTLHKEFYDTATAKTVKLRGNNYMPHALVFDPYQQASSMWHSTFDPDKYNASAAWTALNSMSYSGYNWVKVMINDRTVGASSGSGLNVDYVNNVADFVRLAAERGIYVTPVLAALPKTGGYVPATPPGFENINALNLTQSFVAAKGSYAFDFVTALQSRLTIIGVPVSTIAGYQIENEHVFVPCLPPLSDMSGYVTAGNGLTYNMALAADKERMTAEMTTYYINEVRSQVRSADPSALVSIGFFSQIAATKYPLTFTRPNGQANVTCGTSVRPEIAISSSSADFVDVHVYSEKDTDFRPSGEVDLTHADSFIKRALDSMGLNPSVRLTVLGEYGAAGPNTLGPAAAMSIAEAANVLRLLQSHTCSSRGIQGWAMWTWDTKNIPDQFEYTVTENGGFLNGVLAPFARPDPCNPGFPI